MKKNLLLLCLVLIVGTSCNQRLSSRVYSNGAGHIATTTFHQGSFDDILARAQIVGKPVMVDFYTTWCAPCRLMDEYVFNTQPVAEFFNEHFISYKINAELGEGVKLAQKYDVDAYPTVLFLNNKGRVITRQQGMGTTSSILALGRKTLNKVKD